MAEKPNDGGCAFPRLGEGLNNSLYDEAGMSVRTYIATQALAGILAHVGHDRAPIREVAEGIRGGKFEVQAAVRYADALIAELGL